MKEVSVTLCYREHLWFAESKEWPGCKLASTNQIELACEVFKVAEHAFKAEAVKLIVSTSLLTPVAKTDV